MVNLNVTKLGQRAEDHSETFFVTHDMTVPSEFKLYVRPAQGYLRGKTKKRNENFLRAWIRQCKCKCAVI